jgi:hypothetical protein
MLALELAMRLLLGLGLLQRDDLRLGQHQTHVRLQEDVIVQPAEGALDDLIDEAVRNRLSFAQPDKVLGEGGLDRHMKAHRDDAFAFIRERGSDAFHAGAQ